MHTQLDIQVSYEQPSSQWPKAQKTVAAFL